MFLTGTNAISCSGSDVCRPGEGRQTSAHPEHELRNLGLRADAQAPDRTLGSRPDSNGSTTGRTCLSCGIANAGMWAKSKGAQRTGRPDPARPMGRQPRQKRRAGSTQDTQSIFKRRPRKRGAMPYPCSLARSRLQGKAHPCRKAAPVRRGPGQVGFVGPALCRRIFGGAYPVSCDGCATP